MDRAHSIAKAIEERILAGELLPGHALPTERDMASQFQVGRATVQAALGELASKNLIFRRKNCRPVIASRPAIPAGSRQEDQIAVWIMPEVQDMGGLMMLDGIRAVCAEEGFAVVVGGWNPRSSQSAEQAEMEFLRRGMDDPSVAGLIVWEVCSPRFPELYAEMLAKGTPVVFIDRRPAIDEEVEVVSVNHRRGAMLAVRTLLKLGHERIAMAITQEQAASIHERIEGYRQALWEADLSYRESHLFRVCDAGSSDSGTFGARELRRVLAEPDPPTAVFAVNDMLALHLLEASKELGVDVPGKLSIIGFDWLMRWQPSGGHLSTVAQPFEEIGRAAAQRLLEIARSTVRPTARHILLEASVVLKDTTAARNESAPTKSGATTNGGYYG